MNDEEFQKLLNADPPVVIKPSASIKLIACLSIIAASSLGVLRAQDSATPGTPVLYGIILGGIVAAFFYASIRTTLVLNRDSFIVKELFAGSATYAWKDVSNIVAKSSLVTGYRSARQSRTINFLYEASKNLHEFDLPAGTVNLDQLAQLMNHWRERALSGK